MDTMEEKVMVHQGRNIRRIRTAMGIKQETLAQEIGTTQQAVSKYENQETVDRTILEKCAKVFDVPVELLENMPDSGNAPIQYFKDVNFNCSPTMPGYNNSMQGSLTNYSEKVVLQALQNEVDRLKRENEALKSLQSEK